MMIISLSWKVTVVSLNNRHDGAVGIVVKLVDTDAAEIAHL